MTITNEDNQITITPNAPLLSKTTYTWRISYTDRDVIEQTYSFTTRGQTVSTNLNTQVLKINDLNDEVDKINRPDIFLTNKTPFATKTFSISAQFTAVPNGHYYFTIETNQASAATARRDALIWIHSTGLTEEQISTLDIQYR